MKRINKRIICLLLCCIVTFTVISFDCKKAEAFAITLTVAGTTLLGILATAMVASEVYNRVVTDDYLLSHYGVDSWDELTSVQQLECSQIEIESLKECIKSNYLYNYENLPESERTEFHRFCIAAINGSDGTSALQDFSESNKLKDKFIVLNGNGNGNKQPDQNGNILGSVSLSGFFINKLNEIVQNESVKALRSKYENLPDFKNLLLSDYHICYYRETGRVSLYTFDLNTSKFSGIIQKPFHGTYSTPCLFYETWFINFKQYNLVPSNNSWKFISSETNSGFGNCSHRSDILYVSYNMLDQAGNNIIPANQYNFEDNTQNTVNDFTLKDPQQFDDNEKIIIEDDVSTIINDSVIQKKPIQQTIQNVSTNNYNNLEPTDQLILDNTNLNPEPSPEPEPEPVPEPEPAEDDSVNVDIEDPDNLKSPGLDSKFPFCIPFDLVNCIKSLVATPEAPRWVFPIKVERWNIDEEIVLDFEMFENVAKVCRTLETFGFTFFLIIKTRDLIRG